MLCLWHAINGPLWDTDNSIFIYNNGPNYHLTPISILPHHTFPRSHYVSPTHSPPYIPKYHHISTNFTPISKVIPHLTYLHATPSIHFLRIHLLFIFSQSFTHSPQFIHIPIDFDLSAHVPLLLYISHGTSQSCELIFFNIFFIFSGKNWDNDSCPKK